MSAVEASRVRIAEFSWEPDEIDLFLFSAACWLPHRIHYDHDFARLDGHDGLVVHGPFQIARVLEAANGWAGAGGGRVTSTIFRHVASAYVGERLHLVLDLIGPPSSASDGAGQGEAVLEALVEAIDEPGGTRTVTTGKLTVQGPPALFDGAGQ